MCCGARDHTTTSIWWKMTGLLRLSADGKKTCFRSSTAWMSSTAYSHSFQLLQKICRMEGRCWNRRICKLIWRKKLFVMDNYDSVAQGIVLRLVNYREGAPFLTLYTDGTNALCIDNEKGLAFIIELDKPFANIEWMEWTNAVSKFCEKIKACIIIEQIKWFSCSLKMSTFTLISNKLEIILKFCFMKDAL